MAQRVRTKVSGMGDQPSVWGDAVADGGVPASVPGRIGVGVGVGVGVSVGVGVAVAVGVGVAVCVGVAV